MVHWWIFHMLVKHILTWNMPFDAASNDGQFIAVSDNLEQRAQTSLAALSWWFIDWFKAKAPTFPKGTTKVAFTLKSSLTLYRRVEFSPWFNKFHSWEFSKNELQKSQAILSCRLKKFIPFIGYTYGHLTYLNYNSSIVLVFISENHGCTLKEYVIESFPVVIKLFTLYLIKITNLSPKGFGKYMKLGEAFITQIIQHINRCSKKWIQLSFAFSFSEKGNVNVKKFLNVQICVLSL